jgi:hypothetical protein
VLFPSWAAREKVLDYCAEVASKADPDDPDAVFRAAENLRAKERVVDERLDPYSARFFPRESRSERLAAVIRQERGVEKIVRARTWKVVVERCGGDWRDWEEALDEWPGSKESARSVDQEYQMQLMLLEQQNKKRQMLDEQDVPKKA